MTIHSTVDHRCDCGAHYVPMPAEPACPRCGRPAEQVQADFVQQARSSAAYNLQVYGRFVPPGWFVEGIGDHYYLLGFHFLSYAAMRLGYPPRALLAETTTPEQAEPLARSFVAEVEWDDQTYLAAPIESFLIRLLTATGEEPDVPLPEAPDEPEDDPEPLV